MATAYQLLVSLQIRINTLCAHWPLRIHNVYLIWLMGLYYIYLNAENTELRYTELLVQLSFQLTDEPGSAWDCIGFHCQPIFSQSRASSHIRRRSYMDGAPSTRTAMIEMMRKRLDIINHSSWSISIHLLISNKFNKCSIFKVFVTQQWKTSSRKNFNFESVSHRRSHALLLSLLIPKIPIITQLNIIKVSFRTA